MGDIPNRQTAEPQVDRPRMGKQWMEINGPSILVWGTVCILVMASTGLFVRLWRQQRSDRSASMATTADSEGKSNGLVEEQAVMEKDANFRVQVLSDLKMLEDEVKMAKEYFEQSRKELEELKRDANALLGALQQKRG
ncbi:hypothetical protein GE21DRAFT_8445 [Neurospora crassa]|uniref:Uncharacterized protein n=1 Tax=Neurospora crassa (strain ATCC 24698 / 74-OR23-1A / CBS 708.71 / DSM 1257 / FGSC 987) TaxID=367110 RepID=Q7RWA9_NEUCR|nr:hypothetical protein NCU07237 [Neurospora crassa OR74A]EAA26661.1 hypothetical protein NCU07237 [Neurospora crassa OR74A]KHE85729.1 hypothetical protein GE21DRAFT_8445 [Neurospora crassa]|eukprot:XP_955897.1 hypothetical protein NCU07237 [Neurospora crassa OR74A]